MLFFIVGAGVVGLIFFTVLIVVAGQAMSQGEINARLLGDV